jgi:aryl-alcohol dehydrogenase-like predicted oxidoreductase
MALAWAMRRPFMGSVIFGATTLDQLAIAIGSAELELSDDIMACIDAAHKDHPMPY